MKLELSVTTAEGTADITEFVPAYDLTGEYTQCARTLTFGVLSSPTDTNIPAIDVPLGAGVLFKVGDSVKFSGHVFTRQKNTDASTVSMTCYDRGIYLKRNKAVYNFEDMTPEDITRRVCDDFGVSVGKIEATGIEISRNFIGVTLYQIIQTAYTLASRETGEQYQIRFEGDNLTVIKKAVSEQTLILQGGSNLMSLSVTESVASMVNQVAIFNAEGALVGNISNTEAIPLYGLMQEYIQQSKDDDGRAKAEKLIKDNDVSQKITVNNLGNEACITGNAVVVQEPYTKLFGLFWIDSDVHSWKNGIYLNKLVLNFRRMMDEQEAGSLKVAKYSGSGTSKMGEYLWLPGGVANAR